MIDATIGSVDLYRREAGTGDPALFLIGIDADHTGWARIAPELAADRRCISVDNRDAGRSPRVQDAYGLDAMVADTVGALDAAGVERADVVGQSLGGAIAVRLAARHPERVRRLALISTAARLSARSRAVLRQWPLLRRTLTPAEYHRAVFPWLYAPAVYEAAGVVDDAVAALSARAGRQEPGAFERHVAVAGAWDVRADLAAVRAPALVITGADDLITTPADAEALAAGLPDARLMVLPDAGHSAVFTDAPPIVAALRDFLDGGAG